MAIRFCMTSLNKAIKCTEVDFMALSYFVVCVYMYVYIFFYIYIYISSFISISHANVSFNGCICVYVQCIHTDLCCECIHTCSSVGMCMAHGQIPYPVTSFAGRVSASHCV